MGESLHSYSINFSSVVAISSKNILSSPISDNNCMLYSDGESNADRPNGLFVYNMAFLMFEHRKKTLMVAEIPDSAFCMRTI